MDIASAAACPMEGVQLASWSVLASGARVRLDFNCTGGTSHALVLSFELAASLLMTLPRMLQTALNARFPDGSLRFVHQLGAWQIEQAAAGAGLIMKLCTPDGFEIAFALNDDDANSLGAALTAAPEKYQSDMRRPN